MIFGNALLALVSSVGLGVGVLVQDNSYELEIGGSCFKLFVDSLKP